MSQFQSQLEKLGFLSLFLVHAETEEKNGRKLSVHFEQRRQVHAYAETGKNGGKLSVHPEQRRQDHAYAETGKNGGKLSVYTVSKDDKTMPMPKLEKMAGN